MDTEFRLIVSISYRKGEKSDFKNKTEVDFIIF